jgi:hypothetical protein
MKEGLSPSPTPNSLDAQHNIIAYACSANEALSGGLNALYLPHLAALLGKMTCVANGFTPSDREHGKHLEAAYLMPHESALSVFGLSPQWGSEALITPCHWQVGMNEVLMLNPAEIQLSAAESQALLSAIQPYFAEDGLEVTYESPLVWRARGRLFEDLPFAALERVVGQQVSAWMPSDAKAKPLQRLQSEMQMLLYQHPVNDQRSLQGRWTVNSFWVHRQTDQLYDLTGKAQLYLDLQEATHQSNAAQWRQTWQNLDNTVCKSLLNALTQQQEVSLTLCSAHAWRHYRPQKKSLLNTFKRLFASTTVHKELSALLKDAPTS